MPPRDISVDVLDGIEIFFGAEEAQQAGYYLNSDQSVALAKANPIILAELQPVSPAVVSLPSTKASIVGNEKSKDLESSKENYLSGTSQSPTENDINFPSFLSEKSSSSTLENLKIMMQVEALEITYNEIKKLLTEDTRGFELVKLYNINKKLSHRDQNRLVDIIIRNELRDNFDKRLNSKRFEMLAKVIKKIFPSENEISYFISWEQNLVSRSSRGKLVMKYNNARRRLKSLNILQSKSRKKPFLNENLQT